MPIDGSNLFMTYPLKLLDRFVIVQLFDNIRSVEPVRAGSNVTVASVRSCETPRIVTLLTWNCAENVRRTSLVRAEDAQDTTPFSVRTKHFWGATRPFAAKHHSKSLMIDSEAFLRQEVESASPARLRWLLLQKAHGLSIVVRDMWKNGKAADAKQWVILIQDIFTELLEGIVDPKHELAKQQSDLFIFLNRLLVLADQDQDFHSMDSLTEILQIEKDTWEMLSRRFTAGTSEIPTGQFDSEFSGLNLEA